MLACWVNDKPIVLSADGHDSHETDKLKAVAYEYGIIIFAFQTTHKLQPLDVGVFSVSPAEMDCSLWPACH